MQIKIGLGLSYSLLGHTMAIDYKNIAWSSAKGYDDFKWMNQNVIAFGYEYKANFLELHLDYKHSNNPIEE